MEMLYRSSPLAFSVVNSCQKTVTELSNLRLVGIESAFSE
jgi:hypothetical protein